MFDVSQEVLLSLASTPSLPWVNFPFLNLSDARSDFIVYVLAVIVCVLPEISHFLECMTCNKSFF